MSSEASDSSDEERQLIGLGGRGLVLNPSENLEIEPPEGFGRGFLTPELMSEIYVLGVAEAQRPAARYHDAESEWEDAGAASDEGKTRRRPRNQSVTETAAGKRSISAFRLAMMTYFFTCGGPFGIEPAVGAGGPLLTLISLIIVPLLWSLPQALMAAELSMMMQENGGNIVWVQRAFGNFLGWVNTFNYLVSSFASLSLYPILFVDYLPQANDFNFWETLALKFGFVLVLTLLNIWGIRWITRLSLIFMYFILSPFVGEIVTALIMGGLAWDKVADIPSFGDVQWSLFISTVLWSFGGYDSMGSVAGEVKDGRKTYITGISIGIPLNIVNYLLPVLFGFLIDPRTELWQSGYFTQVAYELNKWLGVYMLAASILTNFGTYNVTMASLARVIWATGRGKGAQKKLPSLVSISWKRKSGTVRPIAGIIIVGVTSAALSLLPFNILVQVTMLVRVVNLLLEYGALIMLKFTEPDTYRPFEVPGGKIGAVLLVVPTFVLSCLLVAGSGWELWVVTIGVNVVIVVCYFLRLLSMKFWRWLRRKYGLGSGSGRKSFIN